MIDLSSKNPLKNKDARRKAEFIMSIVRTIASLLAATILIITHWK